jgi:hypothetical protein
MTVEQLRAWTWPLDWVIAASVIVLAFLIASFAARNSELLMHLAVGRALLDGSYKFGEDPFAYTSTGIRWVNHAWLWDVLAYLVFKFIGGPALVVVKALMVGTLAGFMLAVRRPGQSLWIPAVCTLVAILAVGQRVALASTIVSYLFLGITIYLLQKPVQSEDKPAKRRESASPSNRRLWLLPVLFLFWVNLDQWFFLGPLTVALWWLGDRRGVVDNRTYALVLLAGLLACLINPHHIYAFTLPSVLNESGAAAILQNDYFFRTMFWGAIDHYKSTLAWSTTSTAFLVLAGLSAVSFVVNYSDFRGSRLAVWVAFAALATYHVRAVPFFAVVAGPIAALNFQDAVARRFSSALFMTPTWRQWAIGGRLLTLFAAAILIAVAWPGWLSATASRGELAGRNVAWHVEIDPSLEKAAKQLQKWHDEKVLGPDNHGVSLSPEVAFALAWFAPDEKSFIDNRLVLFEKAAADYIEANKAMTPDFERDKTEPFTNRLKALAHVLRKNDADHLILHFPEYGVDLDRYGLFFSLFEADPDKQFTPVYRDGRTVIFSWDDPELKKKGRPPSRLTRARVSDDKLAFGPQSEAPITERPPAPDALAIHERMLHPRQVRPLTADEATMHIRMFEATAPTLRHKGVVEWLPSQIAGIVGSAAGAPAAGEPYFRSLVGVRCLDLMSNAPAQKKQPDVFDQLAAATLQRRYESVNLPVSTPLLAVRACRRALLDNPNDAATWYVLQNAYSILERSTREREWASRMPLLQSIRQVQQILALRHAVLINPDLDAAHEELATRFLQMGIPGQGGYYDLALLHLSEQLRIWEEQGRRPRETAEQFQGRRDRLQKRVDDLTEYVRKAQTDYINGQATLNSINAKARLALMKGLGGQARDELLKSVEVSVEPEAIPLQLNLMVTTGSIEGEKGIRVGLESFEEQAEKSGKQPSMGKFGQEPYTTPIYEWLQVSAAAASGDYRAADEWLARIIPTREQGLQKLIPMQTLFELIRTRVAEEQTGMLQAALSSTQVTPVTLLFGIERGIRMERLRMMTTFKAHVGDLYVLRGILALESSDNTHAEEMFRKVVELKEQAFVPIAEYYLRLLEANK